jgi:hypothetical protein
MRIRIMLHEILQGSCQLYTLCANNSVWFSLLSFCLRFCVFYRTYQICVLIQLQATRTHFIIQQSSIYRRFLKRKNDASSVLAITCISIRLKIKQI